MLKIKIGMSTEVYKFGELMYDYKEIIEEVEKEHDIKIETESDFETWSDEILGADYLVSVL